MVVFVMLFALIIIEDIILYNYQYIIILILFFKNYNQGYLHWVPSPEYIFVEYQSDRLISLFRDEPRVHAISSSHLSHSSSFVFVNLRRKLSPVLRRRFTNTNDEECTFPALNQHPSPDPSIFFFVGRGARAR